MQFMSGSLITFVRCNHGHVLTLVKKPLHCMSILHTVLLQFTDVLEGVGLVAAQVAKISPSNR